MSGEWAVESIAPSDVASVWSLVAPLLAPAVKRSEGRYDMRAVFEDTQSKRTLLWVVSKDNEIYGALISRTAAYPRASFLAIDFLGGEELALWVGAADKVLASFASDAGLKGLELIGREGWGRVLKPFRWRRNAVMLEKTIS